MLSIEGTFVVLFIEGTFVVLSYRGDFVYSIVYRCCL